MTNTTGDPITDAKRVMSFLKKTGFKFPDELKKVFETERRAALDIMANNAIHEFKVVSFDKQSFDGKPWPKLKAPGKNRRSRMLVKTGRLRNSITVIAKRQDMRRVGSLVPYAAYHNAGTRRLPKRQFIGHTRRLGLKNRRVMQDFLRSMKLGRKLPNRRA